MWGDQLVRPWCVLRGIEATPDGLIMAEVARPDGARETALKRSPSKARSKNWNGLFCYRGPTPVVSGVLFLNGRA